MSSGLIGLARAAALAVSTSLGVSACALLLMSNAPPWWLYALLGVGANACLQWGLTRTPMSRFAALQDGLILSLLAAAAAPEVHAWQTPGTWSALFALTPLGSALIIACYLLTVAGALARSRRRPVVWVGWMVFLMPWLFNALLALASTSLMLETGARLGLADPDARQWLTRALVLLSFNVLLTLGLGLSRDLRWTRDLRIHALLMLSACYAALTPQLANLGASATLQALPPALHGPGAALAAALAQAGLWAQTFLCTGLLLDVLHGRRPTWLFVYQHWSSGLGKGAVFGGMFMLIIHGGAVLADATVFGHPLLRAPVTAWCVGGALLFPLAKTLIESFDGSPPFFQRLFDNYRQPPGYARGIVIGAGIGLALTLGLPQASPSLRFCAGFLLGASAYAGIDLLQHALTAPPKSSRCLHGPRVYLLTAALGGVVGGALAWYVDAAQLEVVVGKFFKYATVFYPAHGHPVEEFVIYPLFSKWGEMNLGQVAGGVRLFYNQSLSGVINWSLAAPLFSINLVLLNALMQRNLAPLKNLRGTQGLIDLGEQAVRVLRWGPWMAPIIFSFLRMAAEPAWYNQDGAIRTVLAIFESSTSSPDAFHAWSLELFLGMLAYDWLRVLIWFDHMGLRVATLVNLTFAGGDALDEKAARYLGHAARTRVIPEGLRRFATWAPLLIPFYIPRGKDWDHVWDGAARLAATPQPLLPSVAALTLVYAAVAVTALFGVGLWRWRGGGRPRRRRADHPPVTARVPRCHTLSNGLYSVELGADGCGYSYASRPDTGETIDLTRRPGAGQPWRGRAIYLDTLDEPTTETRAPWLFGVGAAPLVVEHSPTRLVLVEEHAELRCEIAIEIAELDAVETRRVILTNLRDQPRGIELTSFQELALNGFDAYHRHPAFNQLHVETSFVRELHAIFARNRLLKISQRQTSEATYFHAVGVSTDVELLGYEDSRTRFLGAGTQQAPAAVLARSRRTLADAGLLCTFDPAASLTVRVQLAPKATVVVDFADGYAASAAHGAALITRYLGTTAPTADTLAQVLATPRTLIDMDPAQLSSPLFTSAPTGPGITTGHATPRPWTHALANALGHGAMVSNDGAIFSFARNAQQNSLTPFMPETIPAQTLGQALYIVDTATGEVETPGFVPYRRAEAAPEVTFEPGLVSFRRTWGRLAIELSVCVPPAAPVELRLLQLRNNGDTAARYRIVPYFEMVLAELAHDSAGRIKVRERLMPNTLFFSNPANDFVQGWAVVTTTFACQASETLRTRFFGGGGRDVTNPYFVSHGCGDEQQADDGRRVASFDAVVTIPAHGEVTLGLALGFAETLAAAGEIARRYQQLDAVIAACAETRRWWHDALSVLRVETNDPLFDRFVNDHLPYQVLTARLWARCGAEQRSGAYGYRDQLQDVLPLVYIQPALARHQILLHAAQQFRAGDVLAWWHSMAGGRTGLGARNRASDVHLWLPYLVCRYVEATGDRSILDESVAFLEGKEIPPRADGITFAPRPACESATVLEHCRRAVDFTLARMGEHGLPLLGTGDWNDGLSHPGAQGRGESVWLGFFLHDVLERLLGVTTTADTATHTRYRAAATALREALARMWRNDRYVRVITDTGEEMTFFDALTVAWPVLANTVDFARGAEALEHGLRALAHPHYVSLLTPPFTTESWPKPGRIADYPPGVRENGGQYSHGVSWLVDALVVLAETAQLQGDQQSAAELRARAATTWFSISPLDKLTPALMTRYGLAPQQQPADIYAHSSCEGRGGWSWYTGAAARMLTAAYALLGLNMRGGELVIADDVSLPRGPLQLKRVTYQGREVWAASV